jgi:hypothetical protein
MANKICCSVAVGGIDVLVYTKPVDLGVALCQHEHTIIGGAAAIEVIAATVYGNDFASGPGGDTRKSQSSSRSEQCGGGRGEVTGGKTPSAGKLAPPEPAQKLWRE